MQFLEETLSPFLPLTSVGLLVTPDPAHYSEDVSRDQLVIQYIWHFVTFKPMT